VNGDQRDTDGDRLGDRCDEDADADGTPNTIPRLYGNPADGWDNCPQVPNPGQEPSPDPRYGAACYVDTDLDGLIDPQDNCPELANVSQADYDFDDTGDICDPDDDEDGEFDGVDNCPLTYNYDQTDADGDGIGAACDSDDTPAPPGPLGPLGPPATPAQPAPAATVRDVTMPTLGITVSRTLRLRELGRSIAVAVRCDEGCTLRAELIVKRRRVAAGTATLGGPGTTYVFMRRVTRLRPAGATLRLTATDAAGNVRRTSRAIRLRR
jgi:hypothetical protein